MAKQQTPCIETCPNCASVVNTTNVLIEYETENGRPEVWAECPTCRDVVHPE